MIYEIECSECKGSGRGKERSNFITGAIKPLCSTCSGAGGWWLGVEEECMGSCDNCTLCDGPNYIPYWPKYQKLLTVEEVTECYMDTKLGRVRYGLDTIARIVKANPNQVQYKGSPVRLIGRDNANDSD